MNPPLTWLLKNAFRETTQSPLKATLFQRAAKLETPVDLWAHGAAAVEETGRSLFALYMPPIRQPEIKGGGGKYNK